MLFLEGLLFSWDPASTKASEAASAISVCQPYQRRTVGGAAGGVAPGGVAVASGGDAGGA